MLSIVGKRGFGSVYRLKGRKIWQIKYYLHGRAYRESSKSEDRDQALQMLRNRLYDLDKGITPNAHRVKFDELANDVLLDYRIKNKKTVKDLIARLNHHILPYFGKRKAISITSHEILQFTAKRQIQKASNGEINRELTIIRRAYNLAVKHKKLFGKPAIDLLVEDNIRTGFFEANEFASLCRHLPAELRAVVTFAYVTGWRINSEVLPLTWFAVDFKAGEIRLDPGTTKNKEGRTFPMIPVLRQLLESLAVRVNLTSDSVEGTDRGLQRYRPRDRVGEPPFKYVFHRNGKRIKYFRRSWLTACKKAGLVGRIPHDFRRTAVRNLVRSGVPEVVAMRMTGHKTRSVFERYNIVSSTDIKEAGNKLETYLVVYRNEEAK